MSIRIILDEDLTPIQAEVLGIAKKLGEQVSNDLWQYVGKELNKLALKHRELSLSLVISFFSEIITTIFSHGLNISKSCADQVGDNEITKQSIFDELIEGIRVKLNLPEIKNNSEFKKLST